MGSKRRDPSRPGTAALTRADFDEWKAGRLTLADLAARCGTSVPAISKAFRRWRSENPVAIAKTEPAAEAAGSAPAASGSAAPSAPGQPELPSFTSDDAATLAKSAAFAVLMQAHSILTAPAPIGPSGLKATMTAAVGAIATLERFGVIDLAAEEANKPTVLTIRCMTEEEMAEAQRVAEAGAL